MELKKEMRSDAWRQERSQKDNSSVADSLVFYYAFMTFLVLYGFAIFLHDMGVI